MLFSTVFNWTFRSRKNFCSLQNKLHGIMANKLVAEGRSLCRDLSFASSGSLVWLHWCRLAVENRRSSEDALCFFWSCGAGLWNSFHIWAGLACWGCFWSVFGFWWLWDTGATLQSHGKSGEVQQWGHPRVGCCDPSFFAAATGRSGLWVQFSGLSQISGADFGFFWWSWWLQRACFVSKKQVCHGLQRFHWYQKNSKDIFSQFQSCRLNEEGSFGLRNLEEAGHRGSPVRYCGRLEQVPFPTSISLERSTMPLRSVNWLVVYQTWVWCARLTSSQMLQLVSWDPLISCLVWETNTFCRSICLFEANSADSGLIRRRIWFMNYGPSIGKTHFTVLCWKMHGYRYHLLKGTVLASTQKHPESQHTPWCAYFNGGFCCNIHNNITFINESAISFLHFSMIWIPWNSCQVRESPFCKGDDTMEDEPEAGLIPLRGAYTNWVVSWDIRSYW